MPHLGSMPDPKDKPRTLLVGWISRLDLALELGLRSTPCAAGRRCGRVHLRSLGARSTIAAPLSRNGWKQEQAAPRRRRAGGRR
jgi:hypothetical protein